MNLFQKRSATANRRIATAIIVLIAIIVLARHAIGNQLIAWHILPQPTRITQLSFANASHLPTTYSVGVPQHIGFTVRNEEHQDMSYSWFAFAQAVGSNQTISMGTGVIFLSQGQSVTVPVEVLLANLGPRAKVTVKLPTVHKSISYIATLNNG